MLHRLHGELFATSDIVVEIACIYSENGFVELGEPDSDAGSVEFRLKERDCFVDRSSKNA